MKPWERDQHWIEGLFYNLMLSTFELFSTCNLTFRKEQTGGRKILRLVLTLSSEEAPGRIICFLSVVFTCAFTMRHGSGNFRFSVVKLFKLSTKCHIVIFAAVTLTVL